MKTLGQKGEELAVDHLRRAGYLILARNWRCDRGEIDIVAKAGNILVFVEVKTRRSSRLGTPQEAVDFRKQEKLRYLAYRFINATGITAAEYRFDVAAINAKNNTVTIIKNAF
ncbi:YraN family protein [Dethiobacter alkaliphilus]|uniref:YraN family protein n=1 Tax=Dethiobacter alkaliphilus TaxID=427926 RepID=UPI002226B8EB|nr:YraN family protein [Dethiobacter alkaliphilus]MCW3489951.1 YraN family protein [Dethiobacter alkaliphilus]